MPAGTRNLSAAILLALTFVCVPGAYVAAAGSPIDDKVLKDSKNAPVADVQFIDAQDGTKLAFRRYIPREPKAVLLFYHTAGLHSAVGYPQLAFDLARNYNIAVFTADLRGHGESEGERGDAPSVDAFWYDIDSMLEYLHIEYKDLSIYLGGHSSGAAIVLNYISQDARAPVEGLVFLSPNFGEGAKLYRNTDPEFMTADTATKIYSKATLGFVCRHCPAFSLNYPHRLKVKNPGIVTEISVTTTKALTPAKPEMQVRKLRKPFIVYTGSKDELVQGGRTKMFFKQNGREPWMEQNELLKGETHLSVLLNSASEIGTWLTGHSAQVAQN